MALNQYQDNGKTVGCLGGAYNKTTLLCVGGAAFVTHQAGYNALNPSGNLHYKVRNNWSLYAQFAEGSNIPPSSVFDSAFAQVAVLPSPTKVKTFQAGSAIKFNRWTLDFDAYYSHFQNPYTSIVNAATSESYFYQTGPSNTKGVEAEANFMITRGLNLYVNGSAGAAKYQQTKLWVANTPRNTEAFGLTYRMKGFDFGFMDKRVGPMWNDNGTINEAVAIDPFNTVNVFANYTSRSDSWLRGSKLRFGVNNLTDNRAIVGVTPAATTSNLPAGGDTLTIVPARSVFVTMTFGYAPEWGGKK